MKTLPRKPPRLPHCLGRHQRDHPANERALVHATRCTPPQRRVRRHLPPARVARPPSLATVDASSRIRRRGGDPSRVAPRAPSSDPAGPWFSPPPRDEPTVSLTDAEREEMARLEASGDAFERLVELAKQGGVDIPSLTQGPRGVHVRAHDRHRRHPRPNPSPASQRDSPKPPWLRQRARRRAIQEDLGGCPRTRARHRVRGGHVPQPRRVLERRHRHRHHHDSR